MANQNIAGIQQKGTNIGIGLNSPSSLLEVYGGDVKVYNNYKYGWRYSAGDTNMYNYIYSTYDDTTTGIAYRSGSWTSGQSITCHNFQTYTSSAWQSRLVILQNGNIGIGTTSPSSKLDVTGTINIDGSSFHTVANVDAITAPSDQGLVAYYGFDEIAGTDIVDYTGRNNTTSSNLTYTTTAIKGYALDGFGNDNNNVVVPNSSDFDFGTGDFAVSLWCRPNSSYANSLETLIEIGRYTAGILIRPGSGVIQVYIQYSGCGFLYEPSYTLSANTWYHIVVTRVSSTLGVYVNGTRIGSTSCTCNIQVSDTGYIGRSSHTTSGQVFHGIIDEVKIYSGRGLTYGEVRGQYLARGGTSLGGPVFTNTSGNIGIATTTPQVQLDIKGNVGITSSNYLYFGHSTTNIGAWQTRLYSSGGVQYINSNGFNINNSGYGSSTWFTINSNGYTRVYERLGVGVDPSTKFHVSGGAVLLDTGYVNEYLYSINRTVAAANGSTTLIGSLATSGNSNRATIEIHHHDCGTIEYSMFELIGNYYTGGTTDWVQLPSRTQAHYAGDRNGVVVDARLATTGGSYELRLRSIGGACSAMGVNIKIRSNTALTESSTTGTGGTVAGLLGFNRYEFPVTDGRFNSTSNGLFITPNGRVGVNNTSPGYALDVSGTIYASSDVVAYSDISVKENIREIPFSLDRVLKIRGVLYDRTDTGTKNNIGFVAQELDEQFPELVETNPDGTKAVKYQNAVAVLVEAIKELANENESLKERLKSLENSIYK